MTIRNLLLIGFIILILLIPRVAVAQVVINEFSSGTSADWVEIYNESTESADLSQYRLRDSASGKKDLSGTVLPASITSFFFSNRLNNAGDVVKLLRIVGEQEELLEEIAYGDAGGICAANKEQTIGRLPNDLNKIVLFAQATQDVANTGSVVPCEENKPDPSPSPKSVKVSPSPASLNITEPVTVTVSIKPSSTQVKKTSQTSLKPLVLNGTHESTASMESIPFATGAVLAASDSAGRKFPLGPLLVFFGVMTTTIAGLLAFKKSDQTVFPHT